MSRVQSATNARAKLQVKGDACQWKWENACADASRWTPVAMPARMLVALSFHNALNT